MTSVSRQDTFVLLALGFALQSTRGGVSVSPQFLIVGSHEDYGVAVVPLFVEDFGDRPGLELVVLDTLLCIVDVVTG
jgi:hypothetical protein